MNQNNVRLGEIRTEDRIDEAKIHEPNAFHFSKPCHKIAVVDYESSGQGDDMLPIQKAGTNYREG